MLAGRSAHGIYATVEDEPLGCFGMESPIESDVKRLDRPVFAETSWKTTVSCLGDLGGGPVAGVVFSVGRDRIRHGILGATGDSTKMRKSGRPMLLRTLQVGVLAMATHGCSTIDVESRGAVPLIADFALAPRMAPHTHEYLRGLKRAGIQLVPPDTAVYIIHAQLGRESATIASDSGSGTGVSGGVFPNHQYGDGGLWFALDLDGDTGAKENDGPSLERDERLVLTMTVVSRLTGRTVWQGTARDWGPASRPVRELSAWVVRAVQALARVMRAAQTPR